MPTIFCKESKKHNLIYDLPVIFTRIQQQHQVPAGDFPDCAKMQVSSLSRSALSHVSSQFTGQPFTCSRVLAKFHWVKFELRPDGLTQFSCLNVSSRRNS